ncbi:hypothetical protein F4804DRAFT_65626 [Jackrogersella minutella]|nr:hypothetical protein F4804DRAFT_65626 [Jackrogersella minutella]
MAVWSDLPAELRLKIYELLDHGRRLRPQHEDVRQNHHMSAYAAVSNEWQEFFEMRNFGQLVIRQSDLQDFERLLTKSRRCWLNTLWLQVELPRYNCFACHLPERSWDAEINSDVVNAAIWKLFTILSQWKGKGQKPTALNLVLSAHSPSDREHHFRDHRFDDDLLTTYSSSLVAYHHDYRHGWDHGVQLVAQEGPRRRLLGEPLKLDFNEVSADLPPRLPSLDFIVGFFIPRQFYRRFSNLELILGSLPNLKSLHLEYWRHTEPSRFGESDDVSRLRRVIQALPPSLYSFTVFRDANDALHWGLPKAAIYESNHDSLPTQVLKEASYNHTIINMSFVLDAKFFFLESPRIGETSRVWPNLESLTITSFLLSSRTMNVERDKMLIVAATTSRFMPKLRMLQIWFTYLGKACIFRYKNTPEGPHIEWLYTKRAPKGPSPEVLANWQMVADEKRQGQIRVEKVLISPFKGQVCKDHATIIPYLEGNVVLPSSARQMDWEVKHVSPARAA